MKPYLLVAESNPTFAAIYQQFLQRHGYHVVTVSGGLECLARVRRHPPELLVLSDALLWGGSEGVLAQLREDEDLQSIPVVRISQDDSGTEHLDRAGPALAEWPVVDCLQEPFSLFMLRRVVRSATGHDSLGSEHDVPAGTALQLCS